MANVYSFLNFQCALSGPGGVINLGNGAGAAAEGVQFSPASEFNTMLIGADGSGQHSLSADKSGRIVVRLLKTSPTNRLLSAMAAFQRANPTTHGQNTIAGTDTVRGDVVSCQQVAFSKIPELNFAKEAGLVEWEFQAIKIDITLGA